jgi:hypothetical protein
MYIDTGMKNGTKNPIQNLSLYIYTYIYIYIYIYRAVGNQHLHALQDNVLLD